MFNDKSILITGGTGSFGKQYVMQQELNQKYMRYEQLALLHCNSSYPAPVEQSNRRTIPDLQKNLDVIAGLSDHSMGTTVSIASAALGASLIEKRVALSRQDKGPDSDFFLEPGELKRLCMETKNAWLALGQKSYRLKSAEQESLKYRRSIYVVEDMKAGVILSGKNLRRFSPEYGLAPKYHDSLPGKKVNQDVKRAHQ